MTIYSGRLDMDSLQKYVERHLIPNLRVTIIQPDGKVIYDNSSDKWEQFPNHASRKEIQNALMQGSGYAISRRSESIQGEEYFYSAHYFPSHRLIIRSALPYNLSLTEHLKADSNYIWFTLVVLVHTGSQSDIGHSFLPFHQQTGDVHHQATTVCHESRPERTD